MQGNGGSLTVNENNMLVIVWSSFGSARLG